MHCEKHEIVSLNFDNVIPKLLIFLQFNLYCKMTVKFIMKNTHEKHEIGFERVFEENLTNEINLEWNRKIKVKFEEIGQN